MLTVDNAINGSLVAGLDARIPVPAELVLDPATATSDCGMGSFAGSDGTALVYTGGSVSALGSCTIRATVATTAVGMWPVTTDPVQAGGVDHGTAMATLDVVDGPMEMDVVEAMDMSMGDVSDTATGDTSTSDAGSDAMADATTAPDGGPTTGTDTGPTDDAAAGDTFGGDVPEPGTGTGDGCCTTVRTERQSQSPWGIALLIAIGAATLRRRRE